MKRSGAELLYNRKHFTVTAIESTNNTMKREQKAVLMLISDFIQEKLWLNGDLMLTMPRKIIEKYTNKPITETQFMVCT